MALKNGQAGPEMSAEADTPFTLKILSPRIGIPPRLISTIYQTLRLFFPLSFSLWDTFSTCLIISPCSPQSPDMRSVFFCLPALPPAFKKAGKVHFGTSLPPSGPTRYTPEHWLHIHWRAVTISHMFRHDYEQRANLHLHLISMFLCSAVFTHAQSALERSAVRRQQENMIHPEDRNT